MTAMQLSNGAENGCTWSTFMPVLVASVVLLRERTLSVRCLMLTTYRKGGRFIREMKKQGLYTSCLYLGFQSSPFPQYLPFIDQSLLVSVYKWRLSQLHMLNNGYNAYMMWGVELWFNRLWQGYFNKAIRIRLVSRRSPSSIHTGMFTSWNMIVISGQLAELILVKCFQWWLSNDFVLLDILSVAIFRPPRSVHIRTEKEQRRNPPFSGMVGTRERWFLCFYCFFRSRKLTIEEVSNKDNDFDSL